MSPSHHLDLKDYFLSRQKIIEKALDGYLPSPEGPFKILHESMRYSIFAGGKRLRPILAMAATEALGKNSQCILPAACALEMIHTYSLIHDDMPAMDDDDLRRGNPTNHKVFGEAIAMLAGDSLLTEAFHIVAKENKNSAPATTLRVLELIANASGSVGMAGGQALDLLSEKKKISKEELETLHRHKTGKLIQAAVQVGAIMAEANPQQFENLSQYGKCIGLSFQIADDILDIEGGEEIGKDIGSDIEKQKATYPSILGLEKSKLLAAQITEEALHALENFDDKADALREIARFIVYRKS